VRFERHLDHFSPGTLDETWLPLVGSKGWILLTSDKRIRYNLLEKRALKIHAVREFVFTSGNMSGQDMAAALELASRKCAASAVETNLPSSPPSPVPAKFISAGQRASLSPFYVRDPHLHLPATPSIHGL